MEKDETWYDERYHKPNEWENTNVSLSVITCNSLRRMQFGCYCFRNNKWYTGAKEITVKAWRYAPELPPNELTYH